MAAGGVLALGTAVLDSIVAGLAQPVVALPVGTVAGVGLLLASRASFRLVRAENPAAGVALVSLLLFARMAVAALVLWLYQRFVTDGFLPFAIGFAGGFLIAYGVELARYAGVLRHRARQTPRGEGGR